jgi:hypothetical protein
MIKSISGRFAFLRAGKGVAIVFSSTMCINPEAVSNEAPMLPSPLIKGQDSNTDSLSPSDNKLYRTGLSRGHLALKLVLRRCSVRISIGTPVILSYCRDFPQYFQAKCRDNISNRPQPFPPISFPVHQLPSIQHYIVT